MVFFETLRIVLYLLNWIWTTTVMSIIPSQLIVPQELVTGVVSPSCLLNLRLGRSRCDFGIAWAAIAFIILSTTLAFYALEYCTTSVYLDAHAERLIFSWLAVWWLVAAIALTIIKSPSAPSPAPVPVVFAWMLVVFSLASAILSANAPKIPIPPRVNTETDDHPSTY